MQVPTSSVASTSLNPYYTAPGALPSVEATLAEGIELPLGGAISKAYEVSKTHLMMMAIAYFVVAMLATLSAYTIIGLFLVGILYVGLDIYIHKVVTTGREPRFESIFSGFNKARVGDFFTLGLLRFVGGLVGLCFFVLPGIWFLMATHWAKHFCIDREMSATESITMSIKTFHSRFFANVGFIFGLGLFAMSGYFACGIGLYVTVPLAMAASTWVFHKNFGIAGGAERL